MESKPDKEAIKEKILQILSESIKHVPQIEGVVSFGAAERIYEVMESFSASQNSELKNIIKQMTEDFAVKIQELKKDNEERINEILRTTGNAQDRLINQITQLQSTIEELRNKNKQANEFICDIAKLLGEDDLGLDDKAWTIDDFKDAISSTIEEKEKEIVELKRSTLSGLKIEGELKKEIERLKGLIEKMTLGIKYKENASKEYIDYLCEILNCPDKRNNQKLIRLYNNWNQSYLIIPTENNL